MTDGRQRELARLGRIRRWVTVGSLAAFGAFFGLAAEHAVGSQASSTTPAREQQQQQQSQAQSDDSFFGGDDGGGDRSGGSGFGGSAPQTPPAGQSRVS